MLAFQASSALEKLNMFSGWVYLVFRFACVFSDLGAEDSHGGANWAVSKSQQPNF
jgi:hypothetical protein